MNAKKCKRLRKLALKQDQRKEYLEKIIDNGHTMRICIGTKFIYKKMKRASKNKKSEPENPYLYE